MLDGSLERGGDGIAEHLQGHHQLHQLQPLPRSSQALGHSFWAKTSYLIEIDLVAKQLVEQHAQEP